MIATATTTAAAVESTVILLYTTEGYMKMCSRIISSMAVLVPGDCALLVQGPVPLTIGSRYYITAKIAA
jgi:hypothetical protein